MPIFLNGKKFQHQNDIDNGARKDEINSEIYDDQELDFLKIWQELKPRYEAFKITLIYAVIGGLWIIFSDKAWGEIVKDVETYKIIQILKGSLFIFVTALVIYVLVNKKLMMLQDAIYKVLDNYKLLRSADEKLRQQYDEVDKHYKALIVSEQRYELSVEGANDGIWDWDIKNNSYFFSNNWKTMLGYEDGEIENTLESWQNLIHPSDKEITIEKVKKYIYSKRYDTYQGIYRLRCKDGTYKWILCRGKALRDEDGNAIRVSGSTTDITEQTELQQTLKAEKEFSEGVLNGAPIIVIVWRLDGTAIRFNKFAEDFTGFKKEEVLGKKWIEIFIPEQDRLNVGIAFDKLKSGEHVESYENKLMRKDGELVDVLWNNSIVYSNDGNMSCAISMGTDLTKWKETEEKMYNLVYYDTLTGLPNRAMFEHEFDGVLEGSLKSDSKLALLYIDIDNFKNINDTLGHGAGDYFLKYVSGILKAFFNGSEVVARLSGDEFIILIENVVNIDNTIAEISEIFKLLRKPCEIEGHEFFITVSIGVAIYPEHGRSITQLLKNANTAMFSAKDGGKDRLCIYRAEMEEKLFKYIDMDNQLRRAIKNEEFFLNYQPQIDLVTGKMIGVEALVRWAHPVKGLVPPMDFIPFAEKTGHIAEIGKWVFKNACNQKKLWEDMGFPSLKIAINLSGKRFAEDEWVQDMLDILKDVNVNYTDIQLEVTETVVMADMDAAIQVMNRFRKLGVKFALDDFGTGYSSLNYLKNLPIDIIKMDKTFVQALTSKSTEAAIAKSVIQLAHDLNLKVVAEGIETIEQLEFLKNHNCDIGQGFLFSKPISPKALQEIMKHDRNFISV